MTKMQDMQFPLITLGITCFNAQDTIARAIESALAQDYPHTEIIIVDDGSGDGSVEIIQSTIAGRANCQLFVQENQGSAVARNKIIAHARGEFVAFFDDDDESLPERITKQYERLAGYERTHGVDLVACYASGTRYYPNGYQIDMGIVGTSPQEPHGTDMARNYLFYHKVPGVTYGGTPACAMMARKSTFLRAGGFDAQFRRIQDLDLGIRIALAGGHFIGTSEKVLKQYATGGADKRPEILHQAHMQLIEKYKDFLTAEGRYDYARRWAEMKYYHFSGQKGKRLKSLLLLFLKYPQWSIGQFLQTGIKRWLHECKMRQA